MNEYGRIANGGLVEARMLTEAPSDDWLPFKPSQRPSFNPQTQEVVEIAPLIELDGITRQYQVLDLSERRPAPNEVFVAPVPNDGTYVPQEVPMWAFRLALEKVGMLNAVLEFIRTLPHWSRREAETHLEYGNFIRRDHPLMAAASQLGLDSDKVDDIFRVADELKDGVADFGEVPVGPANSPERTLWNQVKGWVSGLFGGG